MTTVFTRIVELIGWVVLAFRLCCWWLRIKLMITSPRLRPATGEITARVMLAAICNRFQKPLQIVAPFNTLFIT